MSRKRSKHIWVDSVFNGDSKYAKKSIGFHASFEKSNLVFQRSYEKPTSRLLLRKDFASEKMLLRLGYRTAKTAGLYLVPSKSYSKNSHTHGLFKRTIPSETLYFMHINTVVVGSRGTAQAFRNLMSWYFL